MKKKKILICIFVLVAIFSLVATPVVTMQSLVVNELEISPQLEPTDVLSPGVSNLLSEGSNPVSIVVQTSSHDYSQISTLVQSLGGKIANEYKNIDALALTIPADKLIDLAASPLVLKIYPETMYKLMTSTDLKMPEDILMTQAPGIEYEPIDLEAVDAIPSTYVNPALTKADQIWGQTGLGSGVKVAIIDTGSWSDPWVNGGETHYPWYWDSVYDGVDLSSDVGTPFEGYGNPMNHFHGTACAALLAARVEITFGPGHPWAESMLYHYPDAGYYDDGTFIVTQSEETYIIDLIEGTQSAVDFYDYYSSSGHTPFMEDLVSKIYLYNDITSGELSLIMHHSNDESTSSYMRVDFNLEGVPSGAYTALSDDPSHTWNPARIGGREFDLTQEPEGNWEHYVNSDGGVLGGLPTDETWSITIHPDFIAGITDWQYQTLGNINIDLIMDEPVTISYIPPRAHIIAMGIAPLASIYAVKIFSHTGAGVPSSKVMEGIDAAIEEGVDVISMSLGGGVGAPGMDPTDLLVDAATAAGISVVVAAGNEGPAPLRVGSPGTAKTAITVGAAMDPIHERVFGGIVFPHPIYGNYYYPSNELGIADFSSRGPTSDGRVKPDVVATGSWVFFGLTPQDWPYTISLGGGTSFSCPQVAGEAALLTAYIKNHDLDLGPKEIKEAIMLGAEPIDGFTEIEQGAGYINCVNSLAILKEMEPDPYGHCHHRKGHQKWGHHHWKCMWFPPPIDTIGLKRGKTTIEDVTLEPGKYEYFAFWVRHQVDAIRITLSGVEFGSQNPVFGDAGVLYLSNAPRDGVEDYMIYGQYFWDVYPTTPDDFVFQYSKDAIFQPGLVRLALAGDFSSFDTITIDEITIEVVEVAAWRRHDWMVITSRGVDVDEAQVVIFDGTIETHKGKVKEGEIDFYTFTMPNDYGIAFVELSWKRDWTQWATSDLDLIIYGPYGINAEGATGASPEVAMIFGEGRYVLLVEGYQVYWNRNEKYILRITYLANPEPLWESDIIALDSWYQAIRLPKKIRGVAVVLILDPYYWYAADFVKL